MLRPEPGVRIPAAVEQDEDRANPVTRGDGEEAVDALLEPGRILLPGEVVEEHAHRVHPELLGPAELAVDRGGIEGFGLPHLKLVDRIGGNVIGAREPGLVRVPVLRLLRRPPLRGRLGDGSGRERLGGKGRRQRGEEGE